jgi:Sporulation and spore germination.
MKRKLYLLMLCCLLLLVACSYSDVNETTQILPEITMITEKRETEFQIQQSAEKIILSILDESTYEMNMKTVYVDEIAPEKIIDLLISENVLSNDIVLNHCLLEQIDGQLVLKLDFNVAFTSYIKQYGSAGVDFIKASLCNTFMDNYNAERILITVDGISPKGEHFDFSYPIFYYELDVDSTITKNLEVEIQTQQSAEEIIISILNENTSTIDMKSVYISEITPENIVDVLISENVLNNDIVINNFLSEEIDGKLVLRLDFNEAFTKYMKQYGSAGVEFIKASLCNTFMDNYNAEEVWITVDGVSPKGEHFDFSYPVYYYEGSI